MEPDDRRVVDEERVETDTSQGLRSVWGAVAAVAAIGAIVTLLYLALPPVWVATLMVLLALILGGIVLARGFQRPRHRL